MVRPLCEESSDAMRHVDARRHEVAQEMVAQLCEYGIMVLVGILGSASPKSQESLIPAGSELTFLAQTGALPAGRKEVK